MASITSQESSQSCAICILSREQSRVHVIEVKSTLNERELLHEVAAATHEGLSFFFIQKKQSLLFHKYSFKNNFQNISHVRNHCLFVHFFPVPVANLSGEKVFSIND